MLPTKIKAWSSSNPHGPSGTHRAGPSSVREVHNSMPLLAAIQLPGGRRQSISRQTEGGSSSRCLKSSTTLHVQRTATSSAIIDNQVGIADSRTYLAVAFSQVQQFDTSSSSSSSGRRINDTCPRARSRFSRDDRPSTTAQTRSSSGRRSDTPSKKHVDAQRQQQEVSGSMAWYELPATSHKQAHVDAQDKHGTSGFRQHRVSSDVADAADSTSSRADAYSDTTTSSSGSSVTDFASQLPDHQQQQLHQYLDHMLEVNRHMNLTAIRDPDEAWQRHIEDSLALLPAIDKYLNTSSSSTSVSSNSSSSRRVRTRRKAAAAADAVANDADEQQQQQQHHELTVIDVGTGAGLPGMVFAVVRPHWKVTLLDSLRKRCDFLQATADMLGLTNVTVVWSRAEAGGNNPQHREVYDLAVARAVAELRVLSELCLPFVRPGGLWVAAKGANPEDEVAAADNALNRLGGELLAVETVDSWAPEGQRTAVVVKKCCKTPTKYPRTAGTPSKKPL